MTQNKKSVLHKTRIWSAIPTPFTIENKLDFGALEKLINHHQQIGIQGLFLGGTCGEGPYLTRIETTDLIHKSCDLINGRFKIAAQVTGNSASRVLENISAIKDFGVDVAVVAEPWFQPPFIETEFCHSYYLNIAEKSDMPICIYIRNECMPTQAYLNILMHPNVVMVKHSTSNENTIQMLLECKQQRPELLLLTGLEFEMVEMLTKGYDGVLPGGGVVIGGIASQIIDATDAQLLDEAGNLQKKCNKILRTIYGGDTLGSWLTGLKYALVCMKIFSSTAGPLQYPLGDETKQNIEMIVEELRTEASFS